MRGDEPRWRDIRCRGERKGGQGAELEKEIEMEMEIGYDHVISIESGHVSRASQVKPCHVKRRGKDNTKQLAHAKMIRMRKRFTS